MADSGSPYPSTGRRPDLAHEVAIVACAKRDLLLRVHRHRLRHEDLEDCYSQATLELVAHAQNGGVFANRRHVANAIELRFLSRVRDRRRAVGGRSPMQAALEQATAFGDAGGATLEVVDARASVERIVLARDDLRRIRRAARRLTDDQRRVIASQLAGESCDACCSRLGWSREKYRKVAQRGRARIGLLVERQDSTVPSER